VGIDLDEDQLWAFLAQGHEGTFTSLRSDGWPVSLPVWYVVEDRTVFLRTRPKTKKVARIEHDPRCSFVVSSGTRWADLKAAVLTCRAVVVEAGAGAGAGAETDLVRSVVLDLFEEKYASFRTPAAAMPPSSQKHYKGEPVVIRLDIVDAVLSWDNSRLRGPGS
jgi:nitroimidazol reductase NimA-like FMN-containing flavoprotein (pyridoxamine 5'-phosphate oxidase superfamily)